MERLDRKFFLWWPGIDRQLIEKIKGGFCPALES